MSHSMTHCCLASACCVYRSTQQIQTLADLIKEKRKESKSRIANGEAIDEDYEFAKYLLTMYRLKLSKEGLKALAEEHG